MLSTRILGHICLCHRMDPVHQWERLICSKRSYKWDNGNRVIFSVQLGGKLKGAMWCAESYIFWRSLLFCVPSCAPMGLTHDSSLRLALVFKTKGKRSPLMIRVLTCCFAHVQLMPFYCVRKQSHLFICLLWGPHKVGGIVEDKISVFLDTLA